MLNQKMNPLIRIFAYIFIFVAYILFMNIYAPLGISWQDYHAQRIFNAVEFLKLNGYLSFYGYTIWHFCEDCLLDAPYWKDKIYFSVNLLKLLPYVIINHFAGKEALFFLGPLVDKSLIFLCGTLISELLIKSTKSLTHLPPFFIGTACFAIFSLAPWTYQMIIALWLEVYFLLFFLIGMLAFSNNKTIFGYIAFFIAGFFHIQWGLLLAAYYCLFLAIKYLFIDEVYIKKYFPPFHGSQKYRIRIIFSLILPVMILLFIRAFAQQYIDPGLGSSLVFRIGISGNDIHNGGLLGALQFLGGFRLTQCFQGLGMNFLSGDLYMKIAVFNCLLSGAGMGVISIISTFGIYLLVKHSKLGKQIFLPLLFALMFMISFLQQSLSVHLMGYSFIFSAIFSSGIVMLMISIQNRLSSPILGLVFSIPCIVGVLILSLRVSMIAPLG